MCEDLERRGLLVHCSAKEVEAENCRVDKISSFFIKRKIKKCCDQISCGKWQRLENRLMQGPEGSRLPGQGLSDGSGRRQHRSGNQKEAWFPGNWKPV